MRQMPLDERDFRKLRLKNRDFYALSKSLKRR